MLTVVPGLLLRVAGDAARADTTGRLSGEVVEGIRDAGFARHFVPAGVGGAAGGFRDLMSATAVVAESCTSAAWCAALFAAHGRLAAYLPEEGRKELWHQSPDPLIAASVMPPQGTAAARSGGWLLDGAWKYASGIEWADWVLLAALTGPGEHRVFAVPAAEITVVPTWEALGLRGTGSHTVVARAVFVPAHRTFTVADLMRAPSGTEARCHAVPYLLVAALLFAGPVWGAARAMVAESLAGDVHAPGSRRERAVGAAAGLVEVAGLLMRQASARADAGDCSSLAVAANRRDVALAAHFCRDAADTLMEAAGTGGATGGTLQRRWRDVLTAVRHPMLDVEAGAAAWVQAHAEPERP